MHKTLVTTVLLVAALLALGSVAYAVNGQGPQGHAECIKENLGEEEQEQFSSIIEDYREKMALLREEMQALRDEDKYEEFREKHEQRSEFKEEKRDALQDVVPEEFADRFGERGNHNRHHGLEKGESGFNKNKQQGAD